MSGASELFITIPLEPPSGNHYKKPRTFAGGISWYHTKEAKAWFEAVAICACGAAIGGEEHSVEYRVFRGKGSRGDVDNYAKVVLDGLALAGVLRNDDSVMEIHGYKGRDRENPRTEITVRAI